MNNATDQKYHSRGGCQQQFSNDVRFHMKIPSVCYCEGKLYRSRRNLKHHYAMRGNVGSVGAGGCSKIFLLPEIPNLGRQMLWIPNLRPDYTHIRFPVTTIEQDNSP